MVRFAKVFNGPAPEYASFRAGAGSHRNLSPARDSGSDWPPKG
jgi:hypothetical protein